MNLYNFIDGIILFLQNDPLITLLVAITFVFLIFRKPKPTLFVLFLILIGAGIYYLILDVGSSAGTEKEKLIHKSEMSATTDRE